MLASRACLLSPGLALALLLGACKAQAPADAISNDSAPRQAAATAPAPEPPARAAEIPPPALETAALPPATTNAGTGWQYQTLPHQYGQIVRAEIASTSNAERLVFENHPVTGRGAHLELPTDVECPTGCKVRISRDGAPMAEVLASRPENPDIRLNLDEPRALWNSLRGTSAVSIEYPAKTGPVVAEFAVSGVDLAKLPGWAE